MEKLDIENIKPDPEGILVCYIDGIYNADSVARTLDNALSGATVLILPKSMELQSLSEKDMNTLGWYRRKDGEAI